MQVKQLGRVEIKNADKGEVSAVFSTFNVLDSDNDVTLPGAFDEGAELPISAYGHASWQGAYPLVWERSAKPTPRRSSTGTSSWTSPRRAAPSSL